ncbi:MAG: hypothetical protein PVH19_04210 [Planctomycetia bacterium]
MIDLHETLPKALEVFDDSSVDIKTFWLCAHTDRPYFPYEQFMEFPKSVRNALLEKGLLKEGPSSRTVECDGCEDGHVEEVIQVEGPDGKPGFFIPCPECFSVEVDPRQLRQWLPDYGQVAKFLAESLRCFGGITETVPDRLWSLGKTTLSRKPQPVWLARRIFKDLVPQLPDLSKGALLVMGVPPTRDVDTTRLINVDQITRIQDDHVMLDCKMATIMLDSLNDTDNMPDFIFRRKGWNWQIRFDGGEDLSFPNWKGFQYLHQLLLSPGKPIDALNAMAGASAETCRHLMSTRDAIDSGFMPSDNALLSAAGEVADWEAIRQYRSEFQRLLDEKEKASRANSSVELAQIEQDLAFFINQVNEAVGIRGNLNLAKNRQRRVADAFSKSVRHALDELENWHPVCSSHLRQTIVFGNHPLYQPVAPLDWEITSILV